MSTKVFRRAPWIALGAAGVYFFDGAAGAGRRETLVARARGLREQVSRRLSAASDRADDSDDRADAFAPSVPAGNVVSRGRHPLAEESAAGIDEPDLVMSARVLEESERRTVDRAGTADESRRSEDTVEPLSEATARDSS